MATMKIETTSGGEGLKTYYKGKIEELEMKVREKHMDLRRMEAQRNELNAKGATDDESCRSGRWCREGSFDAARVLGISRDVR